MGLLRRNKEQQAQRKEARQERREERRENRQEKIQVAKERLAEKTEIVKERLQEKIESTIDKAGDILEAAKERGEVLVDAFKDLDINKIFDNVKDRLEKDTQPTPTPLPDFSEVLDQIDSDKIQKKIAELETPINSDIIAEYITDAIITEINKIVRDEGDSLYNERNNESGIFSDVIETIDTALASESDKLRGLNYESRTPIPERDILEPNDARHMLIQPDEKTNLVTYGKELTLSDTGELYTGDWHTERVNGTMVAYTGATKTPDSQLLKLLPKSEELEILEQVDLTPNPLHIETNYYPPSEYGVNDGYISLDISSGVAPYKVMWTRKDENGDEIEIREFRDKITIDKLDAGVYTAYVTDSSVITEEIDFREELGTYRDYDNIDNLIDMILARKSRFNLYTNGWEFTAKGLPYVGNYHMVEIPEDQIIEALDINTVPVKITDKAVKDSIDQLQGVVDRLYDSLIGDSVKLGEFFKPGIKAIPIENLRVTPLESKRTIASTVNNVINNRQERRDERKDQRDNRRGALGLFRGGA